MKKLSYILAFAISVLFFFACSSDTKDDAIGYGGTGIGGSGGQGGSVLPSGGAGGMAVGGSGAGDGPSSGGTPGAGTGGAGTGGGGSGGEITVMDAGDVDGGGGFSGEGGSGTGGDTGGTGGDTGGTGGTSGSGGTGGTTSTCTEPDKTVCNNEIGSHCGYTYEYWKDQGTGCLDLTSDGFSVEWSNINNLLGRKGLRPGSMNQIVTYEANYQPDGNSYLCVYGWTQNPLVEYYIVDSWGTWRPPGGEGHMGTVNSDGGTYDIYRTQRVNQPSIEGTATFYQYWSVRTEKRASGTITVANHFDAWQSQGMNMGSLYEVSMCVEGYQSNGTADVSVSMR